MQVLTEMKVANCEWTFVCIFGSFIIGFHRLWLNIESLYHLNVLHCLLCEMFF